MKNRIVIFLALFLLILLFGISFGRTTPQGLNDYEREIKEVVKKVSLSVVRVEAENRTKKVASGVIFDKNGYIVTTALIAPKDDELVVIARGGKKFKAEVVGVDLETRLAVLKIKGGQLPPLRIGQVKDIFPGSWVGVITLSPELNPAITQGIVSSVSKKSLRLNVWVTPGASGSPVVNKEGKMIGILRGVYSEEKPVVFEFREKELVGSGYVFGRAEAPSSGMAVAIPVDVVKKVAVEIREKGKVERGWLGVSIFKNEDGEVEISRVERDSPAWTAGLQENDIILKTNGKKVVSPSYLASEIRDKKPGEKITLEIRRDSQIKHIEVELGQLPEEKMFKIFERKFPRLFSYKWSPKIKIPKPERELRWFWESRKYIGVYLEECTEELSRYFGVKEGIGLLVTKVVEDSPAEKAGIMVGDVIIKADGERVESISQLSSIIQKKEPGEKIKIEFIRNKKKKEVEVEIKEEKRSSLKEWEKYRKKWEDYWKDYDWEKFRKKMKEINKNLEKTTQAAKTKIRNILERIGEIEV
ncbi:MAG: PDZ domain-containing protein [Candidatus Aminicenantia bacterium]